MSPLRSLGLSWCTVGDAGRETLLDDFARQSRCAEQGEVLGNQNALRKL